MGLFQGNEKELQAQIEKLTNENEELVKENKNLSSINSDLSIKVAELSDITKVKAGEVKDTPSVEGKTFTIGDKSYGFHFAKTMLKKVAITVDDVIVDPDLQEQLVAMGSGMIYEK